MRKLKLQMQITTDGFVADPEGQLDWMTWTWDKKLEQYGMALTDSCDTILLGRKMTDGFVSHWEQTATQPESPEYDFAKIMVAYPKVVFSKTLSHVNGQNIRVENGDLVEAVNKLKHLPGKDIIAYGGAGFVNSLIENRLIDELHLFVNPTAIGNGMRIFTRRTALELKVSTAFECGVVVNQYRFA